MSDKNCSPISISERNSRFTYVTKYIPVLDWLPRYTRSMAVLDLIAGITLGLTMIPQSMAHAILAGRMPQYGLYSCFVGAYLYIIFGTVKEISIGSTSLMSLLTLQYTRDMPLDFVILLTFLTGCIEFLMGILNLGFLVDFISVPVTSGFVLAGIFIIIISQLQDLLGLKYKSKNTMDSLFKVFENINYIRPADFALGISSIVFLLICKKLEVIGCSCAKNKKDATKNAVIKKVLWYISIGKSGLVVFITAMITYQLEVNTGSVPFRLSGKIDTSLPKISLPPFSSQVGNQTYTFLDMSAHYGLGLGLIPIISILNNIAIAKAFAVDTSSVNPRQEILVLGLSNIFGSFVSSLPTAGGFDRSAVGSASGVQTPMAGLYSGTMTLLALSFLMPYVNYIPRTTLSAVLISSLLCMIDIKSIKLLWKGSKIDAIVMLGTFVFSLFLIEIGLLLGIFFNLIIFIRLSSRLTFQIINCKTHLGNRYIMLKPNTCLQYSAIPSFCDKIMSLAKNDVPLIIDCERFTSLDYTSMKGIESLSKTLNHERNRFWLLHFNSDIVKRFNILIDNKYIRLIDKEESIVDIFYDDASSNTDSEDPINITVKNTTKMEMLNRGDLSYSTSQRKDSESNAEELTLMSQSECQIQLTDNLTQTNVNKFPKQGHP